MKAAECSWSRWGSGEGRGGVGWMGRKSGSDSVGMVISSRRHSSPARPRRHQSGSGMSARSLNASSRGYKTTRLQTNNDWASLAAFHTHTYTHMHTHSHMAVTEGNGAPQPSGLQLQTVAAPRFSSLPLFPPQVWNIRLLNILKILQHCQISDSKKNNKTVKKNTFVIKKSQQKLCISFK